MIKNSIIKEIKTIGHLDWLPDLTLRDIEHEFRKGHSFLQTPGPTSYPVRPHLEPVCAMGHTVARLVDGKGTVAPIAVLISDKIKIIPITHAPIAVSIRDDEKLWVLSKHGLSLYDLQGKLLSEQKINGAFLQAGKNNSVWVMEAGRDIAYFINQAGEVEGEFGWKNGMNSKSGADGSLYRIENDEVYKMSSNGTQDRAPVASAFKPYEALLWFGDSGFITGQGATFRKYDEKGLQIKQATIQSAGLTDKGEPFAAGREERYVNLWLSQGNNERFLLDESLPAMGAFTVAAVQGNDVLIYGQDHAAWYKGGIKTGSFVVNNTTFKTEIFPVRWSLLPAHLAAVTPGGNLLLSVSSAKGMTLLEIDW